MLLDRISLYHSVEKDIYIGLLSVFYLALNIYNPCILDILDISSTFAD